MGIPTIKVLLLVTLGLSATLPAGCTSVQVEASNVSQGETNSNMTKEDNQCSALQRRQHLLDTRLIEVDNKMTQRDARLNALDTRLNTQHNDVNTRFNSLDTRLNTQHNDVNTRFNRMDSRFNEIETQITDMKEYLQQQMDAMGQKVEWALAGGREANEHNRTSQIPKDCQEAYRMGSTSSGVYRIAPEPNLHLDVFCEQELDGGGWIVFQVRKDGSVNFYQNWASYKDGFGELTGEFWFGNHKIHLLTKHHDQQLKIELMSPDGEIRFASYDHFWIEDEQEKYKLNVSAYSGGNPPGDDLSSFNEMKFTTRDQDNDVHPSISCAALCEGAWWYSGCHCSLNGQYRPTSWYKGVSWVTWKSVYLKGSRMMIRKNR